MKAGNLAQALVVAVLLAGSIALVLEPRTSGFSQEPITPVPSVPMEMTPTTTPPPLPGPPTPTPALPEEGGPPGGIIGGTAIFEGVDGERGPAGVNVIIDRLDEAGNEIDDYAAALDPKTGRFEARALPDGRYRVIWQPPVPPELIVEVSPPLTDVRIATQTTIRASVIEVTITAASRVLDLQFFVRARAMPGVAELPPTGTGAERGLPLPAALVALIAAPLLALAAVHWMRSRRPA